MLLKNTSSWRSLSKSAAMTVRMGEGEENACVAIFYENRVDPQHLKNFYDDLKDCGCNSHPEFLLAVLQVKAMWTVPVAVNNVSLPVTIEVSKSNTSAVLISVFNSCEQS